MGNQFPKDEEIRRKRRGWGLCRALQAGETWERSVGGQTGAIREIWEQVAGNWKNKCTKYFHGHGHGQ